MNNKYDQSYICQTCARVFSIDKDFKHDLKCCPYCKEERKLKEVK